MSIKQESGTSPHSPSSSAAAAAATKLHNPYEGKPSCAKQLNETIDVFLSRLPPATTDVAPDCPWIYVANPFIPREDRGGEEAPAEFGAQLGKFVEGGEARLEMFGDLLREVQEKTAGSSQSGRGSGGPSKTAVNREVAKQREGCVNDILMLAKVLKVRTGKVSFRQITVSLSLSVLLFLSCRHTAQRSPPSPLYLLIELNLKWMLFIEPAFVNEVWATVARATVKNELGIAAKVAPRAEKGSPKERLVCIYTYDFSDRDDIARVLGRMKQLDLVRTGPGRKPIYYKAGKQELTSTLSFRLFTDLGLIDGQMRTPTWVLAPATLGDSELRSTARKIYLQTFSKRTARLRLGKSRRKNWKMMKPGHFDVDHSGERSQKFFAVFTSVSEPAICTVDTLAIDLDSMPIFFFFSLQQEVYFAIYVMPTDQ